MLIIPLWRDTRKLLTWVMFSQGATGWLPGGLGGTCTICTSAGGKGAVGPGTLDVAQGSGFYQQSNPDSTLSAAAAQNFLAKTISSLH